MSGQIEAGRHVSKQNHISHIKWNKRWIILELNVSDYCLETQILINSNLMFHEVTIFSILYNSRAEKVLNQIFFKDNDIYIYMVGR